MSLGKKTTMGIFWNFTETLARRGIGILITLILAKLLTPEDFGLIALMSVFLTLASTLMESGFRQALIRIPEITERHYNTGFYSNLMLGAISYLLVFIAAPFIADYYDEPRLIMLVRIISLTVIIDSFQVVQRANLSRALNFKIQMKAALPAGILSGVGAITLAYYGAGVWALIMQVLLNSFIQTVLLWNFQRWRPALIFDKVIFKEMYAFGYKIFISRTIDTISKNLYVIVIAKVFSAPLLGLYFFAHQIKTIVVLQLVNSIQAVTFPALSALQNNEEHLKSGYKRLISVTTYLLFPIMLFLAVLAPTLFTVFFDEKWHGAAFYLQLLCIVGLLYPLHSLNLNVMKVKGRSDLYLRTTILKQVIMVCILFISMNFGIEGILYGQILDSVIAYFINSYSSGHLVKYTVKEQIIDVLPGLGVAAAAAAVGFFWIYFVDIHPVATMIIAAFLMGSVYLLLSYLFRVEGYVYIEKQLKNKLKKK